MSGVLFAWLFFAAAAGGAGWVWLCDWIARRDDVATVRTLQPPPRSAVITYPEYSEAAMDALLAEVERGTS